MLPPFMELSPLVFAREYQRYRAETIGIPFHDTRLLAAAEFWMPRFLALDDDSYASFWLEDLPPLLTTPDPHRFDDLRPDEAEVIATFLRMLNPERFEYSLDSLVVLEVAARKWFYVGEVERALDCLRRAGVGRAWPDDAENQLEEHGNRPGETSGIPGNGLLSDSTEPSEIPRLLLDRAGVIDRMLSRWLSQFDAEWSALRESGNPNQAQCVLVEHDADGRPIRGRLRTLEAHIEMLPKDRDTDEVVFGHQLCAADDPQVRGAYAALRALRNADPGESASSAFHSAIRIPHSAFLRAHFTFANGGREPYGGDSLAFACFVAAYGDWWSKDLHRERRLVSSGVALSGALNDGGAAGPISDASIAAKVERVFFSPLAALVVPRQNRDAAESEAACLHTLHPRRRLRILAVDSAADLIADGNITIPERVCLGEYAVRAAAKYSRSVKVQVPLLTILGYLLLCLIYPKTWVGFDANPAVAEFVGDDLIVRNAESRELWKHEVNPESEKSSERAVLGNLDRDKAAEVACMIMPREQASAMNAGELIVFDDDGRELFRRTPIILGEYPGDTSIYQEYDFGHLAIIDGGSRKLVLTVLLKSYPARMHLMLWEPGGDLAGWYINAGFAGGEATTIVDTARSILHVAGINNRLFSACMFSLPLDSMHGASPPYTDSYYDLSQIERGNQIQYVIFPKTDLCIARGARQNSSDRLVNEAGLLRIDVDELGEGRTTRDSVATVWYYLDENLRVVTTRCDDSFITMRERFVAQGLLPAVDWQEYQEVLARNVRYWMDTGWVSTQ